MLLEAVNWLNDTKVEAKTFGDTFVVLLAERVIQLGYALETLCEDGYAGEAAPIARTMMNGADQSRLPRRDGSRLSGGRLRRA